MRAMPFSRRCRKISDASWSGDIRRMDPDDFCQFCLMLRRALLVIVRWIEQRYPEHVAKRRT